MKKVFISHSSLDKGFARKLDAALVGAGIDVFLDERVIRIGDSIPSKIYEAIGSATHLIYVVSKNSKSSKWVQEELDVAKMKSTSGNGCRILPVLIEETELPISIMHIKYADFKDWEVHDYFLKSVKNLFVALGVKPKVSSKEDVLFVVNHSQVFDAAIAATLRTGTYIDSALDTVQGFINVVKMDEDRIYGAAWAIRKYLESDLCAGEVSELSELLAKQRNWGDDSKLCIIKIESDSLSPLLEILEGKFGRNFVNYDHMCAARDLCFRVNGLLREFWLEAFSVSCGGYLTESI